MVAVCTFEVELANSVNPSNSFSDITFAETFCPSHDPSKLNVIN